MPPLPPLELPAPTRAPIVVAGTALLTLTLTLTRTLTLTEPEPEP